MKQIQARQDETLKLIKEIILNTAKKYNIEIDKIILFGSRARGDYREDSDWDILVIIKKFNKRNINKFILEVTRYLAKKGIDVHIIAVERNYYEKYKEVYGDISGITKIEGRVI